MNYWLHRISHHAEVSYPLLAQNHLSIGYSDFAYPGFIEDVLDREWPAIEDAFDEQWGNRPRTRHNLWRFVHGMKQGDIVVVPSWGTFSVYRIIGEKPKRIGETTLSGMADWHGQPLTINPEKLNLLMTQTGAEVDLGFTWEVAPVALDIPRGEYADAALTARMKVRATNSWMTDLGESVDKALAAYDIKKPVNLQSQIISEIAPLILSRVKSELNPYKFELLVQWYFQRIGASSTYVPSRNEPDKEGDADVVAVFESIRTVIYTQVKFHEGHTSDWALRQIQLYKENKDRMGDGYSSICWVVSSADRFSDECYVLAKENRIQLVDGPQFAQMLLEAGLTDLDKAL